MLTRSLGLGALVVLAITALLVPWRATPARSSKTSASRSS